MGGDDRADSGHLGAEVSLSRVISWPCPGRGRRRLGARALVVAGLLLWVRTCPAPAEDAAECLPEEAPPAAAPAPTAAPWWWPWLDAPKLCPGRVLVLDEVGEPVEGAHLYVGANRVLRTDAEGLVDWDERPCGAFGPELRVGDVSYPVEVVEVRDDEDVVLVLEEERHAILELVDPGCVPWDGAPVRPATVAAVERLGPGRFEVWAAREEAELGLWVDGVNQPVSVPLDGGVHRRTVHRPEPLEIELRCGPPASGAAPAAAAEGTCPRTWWCGWEPCEPTGPDRQACRCVEGPVRESALGREWPLPPGARRVRLELPDEGPGRLEVLERGPVLPDCPADAALVLPDAVSLDTAGP